MGGIATLLLTSLAIMGSPGPATISLSAAGSAHGVRRSLGYLAGIVLGTTIVLLAVAAGVTAILLAIPTARSALLAVSLVYIVWLAYRIATAPVLRKQARTAAPGLKGGTLLGVANPKAWIAIAAVFASARLAAGEKVALLVAMIVLINTSWLFAGASIAKALRDPRRARIVNVILAAALVVSAVTALLE
jgi:threonine/homoserine/homoserine lactone efflux protein